MEENYFRYSQYTASIRSIYGPLFPVPSFYEWLREQLGQPPLQPAQPTSSKSWDDTCSNASTKTNHFDGNKNERWNKNQTDILVAMWKDNISLLQSTRSYETYLKIKTEVDKEGTSRTIKQIKDKLRNLIASYKKAKENNNKTGASPNFPPYFHVFDEVLGCRDVINLPEKLEIGVNSCSRADENDNEEHNDGEPDVSKVVKSVPKEIRGMGIKSGIC